MKRLFKTKRNFRKEFKRQLRYAIAAAVGFMVIFAWRESLINSVRNIVDRFSESTQVVTTEISTAVLITLIGVLIILFSSKLLKN